MHVFRFYNRIMLPKKELQKIDFIISQIGSHEMYERERRDSIQI